MQVKKITTAVKTITDTQTRPKSFSDFIGQQELKKVLQTAIQSATTTGKPLWHVLFSWQSWFGKTTLASLISSNVGGSLKTITAYAISKPADMVTLLNSLQERDVLFIDELHRLKPAVEEVLYIAMEDYCIDMVMPDGGSIRLPLKPFTLVGATTKSESLSVPLKNRFVYKFHLEPYSLEEKYQLLQYYMTHHAIELETTSLLQVMADRVVTVPREIVNFCIQLRDYLVVHQYGEQPTYLVTQPIREHFQQRRSLGQGGMSTLHQSYLDILQEYDGTPVGLKTLAVKLGINEKAVEDDVEPLLFELGKIEKTAKGRVLRYW